MNTQPRGQLVRGVGGVLATALIVSGGLLRAPAPASADAGDATAAVADRVRQVAARASEPLAAHNADVDIPSRGTSDVSVSGEASEAKLRIPATGRGATADDGTVVFDGTGRDSAVAVQAIDGGLRAVIEIQSKDAPETYDFHLDGDVASLSLADDGSVDMHDKAGRVAGRIATPWAYDAYGSSVPTYFRVDGTTLTQVVKHKGGDFAYGILADPRLTYGWGVYLNLRGWEVKSLASVSYTAGAVASMVACSTSRLPSPLAKLVSAACHIVGGASLVSIAKTLTSIARSRRVISDGCYQTKVVPPNRKLKKVAKKNCTGKGFR
jgi:hypothetical protein